MNNELIYDVILRLDPASLKKTQDELNKAMEATRSQGQGAEQAQIMRDTVDALKDFNKVVLEQNKAQQTSFQSLADLSAEMERHKASLLELTELEKKQKGLNEEQAQHQEEIKVAMKAASIEYNNQTRELADVARAGDLAGNTYDDLVKQNRALMIQMRKVPLNDTTGELQRLQGQYKANSDTLKAFDKNIGVNFRNVGNYKSALEGAGDALGSMKGPVGGAASSLIGFNQVVRANPIMALVQVVMSLVTLLGKLQGAADGVAKVMAAVGASFNYVRDVMGSWFGMNEKVNKSMGETVSTAVRLKEAEQDLADLRIRSIPLVSKLQLEIARLKDAINDENLSQAERIAIIDEVIEKEEKLAEVQLYLAWQKAELMRQEINNSASTREEREAYAEQVARIQEIEAESFNRRREIGSRRREFIVSERVKDEKEAQAEIERLRAVADEERKIAEARIALEEKIAGTKKRKTDNEAARIAEEEKAKTDAELAAQAVRDQMLVDANKVYFDLRKAQEIEAIRASGNEFGAIEMERAMALQQIRTDALAAGITSEEQIRQLQAAKNLEFDKKVEDTRTAIMKAAIANRSKLMGMAVDGAMALGKALFGESKGMAIAQALIDTYQSANVALKSAPPPFNFALAAANVAAGLVNVNRIRQMKPGSSGGGGGASAPATPSVPSGMASPTFGTVNTNQISASMGGGNMPAPVLILQGDLDSELLAIRVRQGSDQLSSRGVSVVSA
jgi:hypothetical protein